MAPLALVPTLLAAVLATVCGSAHAQYKWVAPGGTVTYSDIPPPPGIEAVSMGQALPAREDDSGLPTTLRLLQSRFPVTLYTTTDCMPCQVARTHLSRRGIPFAERTVRSAADMDAFRRLGFADSAFPAVSVGRERTTGFESGTWDRLLDAAGYPSASILPASYRNSPARALTATTPRPVEAEALAEGGEAEGRPRASARGRTGTPQPTALPVKDPNSLRF
jgi:glutaredoxin